MVKMTGKLSLRIFLAGVAVCYLLIVLVSCTRKVVQPAPADRNMSFLYNPSSSPLHPEFTVYHEGRDYSRLYLKVYPSELLFNQANKEGTFQSRLQVRFEIREIIEGRESEMITDSSTIIYTLKMDEIKNAFIASIKVKSEMGRKYMLQVFTDDLLRNKGTANYIPLDRSSMSTAQNFKVLSATTGSPVFNKVFHSGDIFRLQYRGAQADKLVVKYFTNRFPLPRPPVTNLQSPRPDFIPDSIFSYPYSDTSFFLLPRQGMYLLQVDPGQPGGLALFNFGEDFPRVSSVEEMVGPLAYLTSAIEFNELASQTNPKLAVDNFWLRSAGNVEKARELIRIYYNRVFFANYYFTSYKEGWKTDRGMMYIIYGPPNTMKKNAQSETWTYYRKRSREPLRFTFTRVESPYTDNDFMLVRNFVNSMWVQAVQDWRNGKVFFAEN